MGKYLPQPQHATQHEPKMGKTAFIMAVLASAMASPMAMAAELNFTGVTSELDGVKTAIVALITILLTIFAIVIAWRTFRRSA